MTIQISQLSNGLRIATDSIATVETVALGMWVKAGSRWETPATNGAAHFLEHMAFKGTTSRSAAQIAETIERVGGHMNAATSRESTAYYMRLLHNDLATGMDVLGDILINSSFAPEDVDCERRVILQELGMTLDTPDDLIFDHYQETAFARQPLGHTILGPAENIQTFQSQDLRTFMSQNYHPSEMVFVASGRVDHDAVVKLAEQFYHALPTPHATSSFTPGAYTGGLYVESKELEQLHVILGFEGIALTDEHYYTLSVLTAILGGGMSSRLFQKIREELGLAYTVYAFKACYMDTGTLGIYAGTGGDEAKKLMPALAQEIAKLCQSITPQELERAKAQLKAGLLMGLESTSNRCEYLANQLLFFGRPFSSQEIVDRIDRVTTTHLFEVAQRVFQSPLTLAALGPGAHLCDADAIRKHLR